MSPRTTETVVNICKQLDNLSDDLRSDRNIWKDHPEDLANILQNLSMTLNVTVMTDYLATN
jgi:hypothetical protein